MRKLKIAAALLFAALSCLAAPSRTDLIREKLLSKDRDYVFVAMHRGDWRNYPENSKGAILSCIKLGADVVELDVHRTKDGHFVLNHDGKLDRTTTGKGKISDLTLAEIKKFRLRSGQGGKKSEVTEYEILTLEEAIELARGKILINIDKFVKHPKEILDVVDKCGAMDGVLVKGGFDYEKCRGLFGEKHWKKVESGELLYMPIINFFNGKKKKEDNTERLKSWFAKEPRIGSMYEVCFDSPEGESKLKMFEGASGNPRIWINTLWASLSNGHADKDALKDPEAVWGWALSKGATMIQTEYGKELMEYLRSKGRRNL